jgi:hypothetical protein
VIVQDSIRKKEDTYPNNERKERCCRTAIYHLLSSPHHLNYNIKHLSVNELPTAIQNSIQNIIYKIMQINYIEKYMW